MTTTIVATKKKSWFDMTYQEKWQPESVKMACDIWKLDATSHIPKLLTLKQHLSDLKDYHLNDPLELARCCVDSNFQLETAEDKFRKMVVWRQRDDIDDLLAHFQPTALMENYYPSCYFHDYDKDGDPIWMDRVGASDVWAVYSKYGHATFCKHVIRLREVALRGAFARDFERRTGRPPARVTLILDMEGLSRRHLIAGLIAPLEEGIRHFQDYYGCMAKQIIVAKAPFVFRIVWSIAQYFCNESLKKAITFCNARTTMDTLDKYVDREVLPAVFCKEGIGQPGTGYAQTNLEGGVMPDNMPELKYAGSNETVVSCDSTVVESIPALPSNSLKSSCSTVPEGEQAMQVRATCLVKGIVTGKERVKVRLFTF